MSGTTKQKRCQEPNIDIRFLTPLFFLILQVASGFLFDALRAPELRGRNVVNRFEGLDAAHEDEV